MPTEMESIGSLDKPNQFVNDFAYKLIIDLVSLVVDSVHESRGDIVETS